MVAKVRKQGDLVGILKMFVFSVLVAVVTTAVLLVLSAFLLEKLALGEAQANILVYVIYIISSLTAGLIAGKWQREKKFMWGALSGIVWLVVVFIISVTMNGFSIEAKELFPAIICMVGGGMLGGMLA